MTPVFVENSDRRVLGGFVFLDSITNASIVAPLTVSGAPLKLRVNRSGIYAIFDAPAFSALTGEFNPAPATWPAAQTFQISVQDPSLRYLPRVASVQAPLPLASGPQSVTLFASPSASIALNWAVVRASVTGTAGNGLPWAMVRVIRSDNTVAATGMTDARGEALLAVRGLGVQVSAGAGGAVTENTIAVTVQAWFDPTVLNQPAGWLPNPDSILNNLSNTAFKTGSIAGQLGATQTFVAPIKISV